MSDGYCTKKWFGLKAKDRDFVETFALAANQTFGVNLTPHPDGEYWRVVAKNTNGKFNALLGFEPRTEAEKATWLRGFFDSDGSPQLYQLKDISENSYQRRVGIYDTDLALQQKVLECLLSLGVEAAIRATKNSVSHYGTKTVYEVKLRSSFANYKRFAEVVGSNIQRKQSKLDLIWQTYQTDKEYLRSAQAKGAATRRERLVSERLPFVLAEIGGLIKAGKKPTIVACIAIMPTYESMRNHWKHNELVEMARQKLAQEL